MPWDLRIGVMVSEEAINHLAMCYNMTVYRYKLPGLDNGRDYLLEINPHYADKISDSGNTVDAQ